MYIVQLRTRSDDITVDKDIFHNTVFDPIISGLSVNLSWRFTVYKDLYSNFAFIVKLNKMEIDEIASSCKNLANKYKDNIGNDELFAECKLKHTFI